MANNIVAYIGLVNFDTILYLSRILQVLGRKVLIVDNSDALALTCSIPSITSINTNDTIFTYRRVDFTNMPVSKELAEEYDDILIDCGFHIPALADGLFTKLVYVTDLFIHNIRRIAKLQNDFTGCCDIELLIRDAVFSKISAELMLKQVGGVVPADKIDILHRDENDYENTINSHINQVFQLKLSRAYKEYLIRQVILMCDGYKRMDIIKAYKRARNGD